MDNIFIANFIDFVFKIEGLNVSKYCDKKLKLNEIKVLKYLNDNPDVKMSDLSKYMMITKSAISQMISRLENLGYVERVNSKTDRKIVNIFLTKKGKKTYKKILNNAINRLNFLFCDLTIEEKNIFNKILNVITYKANNMEG